MPARCRPYPEGAAALAEFLDQVPGPVDLLFGALGDKDVAEMLVPLAKHARRIILTTPASDRARPPEELAELLPGREDVEIVPDLGQALERALQPGVRLVVCGSIYLDRGGPEEAAGEVRSAASRKRPALSAFPGSAGVPPAMSG